MSKVLKVPFVEPTSTARAIPDQLPPMAVVTEATGVNPEVAERRAQEMLENAAAEAELRLREAELAAQNRIDEAQREAETLFEGARSQGYEHGYHAGHEAGTQQAELWFEQRRAEAEALITRAQTHRLALMESMAGPLTELVMGAVKTLLGRELTSAPMAVADLVADLLRYAAEGVRVEVRVHPGDYDHAASAHPRWQSLKVGDWAVAVVPDHSIAPGGFEIRSDVGRIDALVETRLTLLEQALAKFMEARTMDLVERLD